MTEMTTEELRGRLLELAQKPINDAETYFFAAAQIAGFIRSVRAAQDGKSTEAIFGIVENYALRNFTGGEIALLYQCLNRYLFISPIIDPQGTAMPKDVTIAEMAYFKRAVDHLLMAFLIQATALDVMRLNAKRTETPTDFWGVTVAAMAEEAATISPNSGDYAELMKAMTARFANMDAKLDALDGKANETQAAANLAAKNSKDTSAKIDVAAANIMGDLADLVRQGERNGRTLAEVRTDTATIAATMPDQEQWAQLLAAVKAAKKPDANISRATAAKILNLLCGHDSRFANLTGQSIGNWVRQGFCPHAPEAPITENDLATKAAFITWVQGMCPKVTAPKGGQIAVGSAIERADSRNSMGWGQGGIVPNLTNEVMKKIQAL